MLQFDEEFVAALNRLTERERKDALLVATEVQGDRRRAGLHVEPIRQANARDIWSVRVNDDLRIILLRHGEGYIPLFVAHHEKAYQWAATRRAIRNPQTGGVTIAHDDTSAAWAAPREARLPDGLFDNYEDRYLLSLGLPDVLLPAIRHIRSDDDLLNITEGLPHKVADRLLLLADGRLVAPPLPPDSASSAPQPEDPKPAGVTPVPVAAYPAVTTPLRLVQVDDADLLRVLDAPGETWMAFLHPSQRGVATRAFGGAARIGGGAGTGKTVVAMHRARHLARQGRRVLLASFTNNASALLDHGTRLICTPEERERIMVRTVHALACDIVRQVETVNPPSDGAIRNLIERFARGSDFDPALLETEWRHVIQALGITCWEDYRDAQRTGRGKRLSVAERERIWDRVIVPVDAVLTQEGVRDWPDICSWAHNLLRAGRVTNPFDAVIVDEMQDLGPPELRLLAALAGDGPDGLTLVGDTGQRIYANRVTLRDLGIDVRGRTRTLTLNYRTTAQIHRFAEAILDGGTERRRATHSLMHGSEPVTQGFGTPPEQYAFVAERIAERCARGVAPGSIAVLAPRRYMLTAMQADLDQMEIPARQLTRDHATGASHVALATIHRAKGLEYTHVFLIGASDDLVTQHLPDDAEEQATSLEEQRNLLYVAATRARDELCITWAGEPNRFLPSAVTAMAYTALDDDDA